ncbi:MAG: hypothetical protein JXR41_03240 [Bacteroidales bacterium]|nr:hypothetical protein [Bacteroidales bacterium]MBN2762081.1 hypothetical protein [Bacteroidales bacterium]
MKEKDLLVDFKKHQLVLYAEKNDEDIGPVQTGSYMARNYLDEFHYLMGNLEKSMYEKLQNGEISPIYLYMTLEELTVSELAARVQIPLRRVKKHLTPKHFANIHVYELKRYADVFNIPVANLFQIISTRQDSKWRMSFIDEEEMAKPATISQVETNNAFVVITKPELNKP